MRREIVLPDSLPLDETTSRAFFCFLQAMANRRCQGAARYGDKPTKKQKYMSRMRKEVDAYKESGNMEQLLNIAVYCFLESEAPENPKFHFEATVASVTRE